MTANNVQNNAGNRDIAEASPLDKIYGIGLSPSDNRANMKRFWNGKNLLGNALMEVREDFQSRPPSIGSGQGKQEKTIVKNKSKRKSWNRTLVPRSPTFSSSGFVLALHEKCIKIQCKSCIDAQLSESIKYIFSSRSTRVTTVLQQCTSSNLLLSLQESLVSVRLIPKIC